jgi:hypothetical protein
LHRPHHLFVRDQAAGVELGEDAGKAETLLESSETIGDDFRRADDSSAAPRLVPRDRLQPLGALDGIFSAPVA